MAAKPVIHGRDHLPGGADPIPSGEGIKFDTDPQEGGFLLATTTDYIKFEAGGTFDVLTQNEVYITSYDESITLEGDNLVVRLRGPSGTFEIQREGGGLTMVEVQEYGDMRFTLLVADDNVLYVDDGSDEIFRIDADGTIHGRAAVGAISWDL